MFTGIVQTTGVITQLTRRKTGVGLKIRSKKNLSLKIGASLSINGCCLTVVKRSGREFNFDLSEETLRKTTFGVLKPGDQVNLEPALTLRDPLGGHFVLGHVDGLGRIMQIKKGAASWVYRIQYPANLAPYLIEKGSIALDGISLTVCELRQRHFKVFIIPHTLTETTLPDRRAGDWVNLEADVLGKYLARLVGLKMGKS